MLNGRLLIANEKVVASQIPGTSWKMRSNAGIRCFSNSAKMGKRKDERLRHKDKDKRTAAKGVKRIFSSRGAEKEAEKEKNRTPHNDSINL